MAKKVFGNSIPYDLIQLDNKAVLGPKQKNFCYVYCHTINFWGDIPDDILIHELVHIWQFYHSGFVYIPNALRAQKSEKKYDYGGIKALKKGIEMGLRYFNYEQQGDIISDYFRVKNGWTACWSIADKSDLHYYEIYIDELKNQKL